MGIAGSMDAAVQPMEKVQFETYGHSDSPYVKEKKVSGEQGFIMPSGQTAGMEAELDDNEKEISKEDVEGLTKAINVFMDRLNCDIKFTVHERTKRLIVEVVSKKDGKVLKEFPPKEMLDVMANISENIGMILDNKA